MKKLIHLILVICLSLCCAPKKEKAEKILEDGVEVVANHLEPYKIEGEPTNFTLEEEFTIDTERNDMAELGLDNIIHFVVDSEENIYLLKMFSEKNFIFKFDRNGNFIASFAQKGQGPAELQFATYMSINNHDDILIIDRPQRRLLFFSKDGSLIKETPIDSNFVRVNPLENGKYLFFSQLYEPTSRYHLKNRMLLCGSSFEEIKELDRFDSLNPLMTNKIKGTRNVFIFTASKGKIYVGNSERDYEIWMYDLEGNLLRKIRKEYRPVDVSEEFKKNLMKRYDNPRAEVIRKNIYFPKYMPPFQYFFTDDEERLFVMTFEKGKKPREYVYDIFNPDGVYIGRTSLGNYGDGLGYVVPRDAIARKNRLYCLRDKENGAKELIVYNVTWE